jgi:LPS sulfotransferase NodH
LREHRSRRFLGFGLRDRVVSAAWPKPRTRFVIFGRGRSGSSLLVELLDSIPHIVCKGELFREPCRTPLARVGATAAAARAEGADVFGFKLLSYQLKDFVAGDDRGFVEKLHSSGYHVIHLRRDNLLRHALSNIRARRIGVFNATAAPPSGPIEVDTENLLGWLRSSRRLEQFEEHILDGIDHLALTYEHDLVDSSVHELTVTRVCDFLGVEGAIPRSSLAKLSPESLQDLVANPDEVRTALRKSEFARYLF